MRKAPRLIFRLALLLAPVFVSSCEVRHFSTDSEYRRQVEADLQARYNDFPNLSLFYSIDKEHNQLDGQYLTSEEVEALDFLYAYMPIADVTDHPTDFFLENVKASFKARQEMGWNTPERLFRHFVLPIRINNENLDTSRVSFYRELKPRLEGLTMEEAILEVNHWCHEKVAYHPSDARTLSPLSVMISSLGRCGEEATFTVAALRSVGIPARQVYTPRWAHTDDNHAWVEAWADGTWHFLGACEPEPVLDLGWFNAPASRSLLMHTKVFGRYDGPEEKAMVGPNFTEINLIENYAETAKVDFKVVDETGAPVDSALVDFKIYNYAEFYSAISKYTDSKGGVFLTAGKGDMLAWASKDTLYGFSKVSFGQDSQVTITISGSHPTEPVSLMIVPPPEKARIPEVTPEQRSANNLRLAQEDVLRKAYMASFKASDGSEKGNLIAMSAGNHEIVEQFLKDHPDRRAIELLESLSHKDLKDVTRDVLDDSYDATESILCPRVENEFLTPYKSFFLNSLAEEDKQALSDPDQLVRWVKANTTVTSDPKAWNIPMSPEGVYEAGMADTRSRNIYYVALARTLGIDARKDPVTGKIQCKDGYEWRDVDFEARARTSAPAGTLILNYSKTGYLSNPEYYTNFTISKIEQGRTKLLTFDEGQVDMGEGVSWEGTFKNGVSLDTGDYLLVSGNRLSDGSVPVTTQLFSIKEGETSVLDLHIVIPEDKLPVIGGFDSESLYLKTPGSEPVSILSTTGRGVFVLGYLKPNEEPSIHSVNDIIAVKSELEKWTGKILLLTTPDGLEWLKGCSDKLPSNVEFGIADPSMFSGRAFPYFIIADTFNRVFFSSEGYTIGLGSQLVSSLNKL